MLKYKLEFLERDPPMNPRDPIPLHLDDLNLSWIVDSESSS